VAVLRLDRPVHYMPHIGPICLPEKNEDFLGQYGWAAGWGALQAGELSEKIILFVRYNFKFTFHFSSYKFWIKIL